MFIMVIIITILISKSKACIHYLFIVYILSSVNKNSTLVNRKFSCSTLLCLIPSTPVQLHCHHLIYIASIYNLLLDYPKKG